MTDPKSNLESHIVDLQQKAIDAGLRTAQTSSWSHPLSDATPSPRRRLSPLTVVQIVLALFAGSAIMLVIRDIQFICENRSEFVVAQQESGDFDIWLDKEDYETATGRHAGGPSRSNFTALARLHGMRRSQASKGLPSHLLLLGLSLFALWQTGRVRCGQRPDSGPEPISQQ